MSPQLKRIPAPTTTPTGRALPFIPDQPRERAQPAEATEAVHGCASFPGVCTVTGPHTAHSQHITAETTDAPISYGFETVSSGAPMLYVDNGHAVDFTAAEAPAVVAQLRAAADRIEAMATQLAALQQGDAQA
jgi:hypothetical protein